MRNKERSNIIKNMNKLIEKKGSALVMSLFFMAILVVLSFAVNYMLLNEVRSERNFLEGVKAYYSAEAGIEDALLQVSVSNAGVDIVDKVDVAFVQDAFYPEENIVGSKYTYDVFSRGSFNPCSFEDQEGGFAVLKSGESVVIPLEADAPFNVEYYIVNTKYPFDTPNNNDPSWVMQNDVLRWKILGNRLDGDAVGKLEAISEYIPIYDVNHNAHNAPSTFGTSAEFPEYQSGKYYDIIDGATFETSDLLYAGDFDPLASDFADDGFEGGFHYVFNAQHPIATFLGDHANNQLVLTNYLNVVPPTAPETELIYDADDYELYYKVDPNPGSDQQSYNVACSAVQVIADGFSENEDFKQSIKVVKPLDQAAPFTDFVWYQN